VALISAVSAATSYAAETQQVEWTQQWTDAYSFSFASEVSVGPGGNAYLIGFGPSTYVRKYSPSGSLVWESFFPDDSTDAKEMAFDSQGNIYGAGSVRPTGTDRYYDGVVTKFAPDGTVVWSQEFGTLVAGGSGTSGWDAAEGVVVDSSDNVYAALYVEGDFDGTWAGGQDIALIKFAPNGTELFRKQWGTTGDDRTTDAAIDASGNIYVLGETTGDLYGTHLGGYFDNFLVKVGPDGTVIWGRQFGSSGGEIGTGMAVDNVNGFVYLSTTVDNSQSWATKYDLDGNQIWSKQVGGATGSQGGGTGGVVDDRGNWIYALNGDTWNGQSLPAYGGVVVKLDPAGNEVWNFPLNNPDEAPIYASSFNPSDLSIYVVGGTEGAFPGQTQSGIRDAFLMKISQTIPVVVDPTAKVDPSVDIGNNVSVGAESLLHKDGSIGDNSNIGADCIIHKDFDIDNDCDIQDGSSLHKGVKLYPFVTIEAYAVLHQYVTVYTGATVGTRSVVRQGSSVGAGAVLGADVIVPINGVVPAGCIYTSPGLFDAVNCTY
jgi:carbonic anhydrase/acetyltransferase-like protein (isoleucine patch superfamily)